ncbi:MAG: flagellar filament capping protein FliD [Desulfovibrionaceae bacterium]
MSDYTSGAIHFTGLGSGTDFDSLITSLVEAESTRITSLEEWKAEWEEKTEKFQELNTALVTLQTTLEGMDTLDEFLSKTVTSTDDTLVSATAGSVAYEGTHTVEVNQLAQNKIMVGDTGFSKTDASINTGSNATFSYTYMGTTRTFTVPTGMSLEVFVSAINTDTLNPGVRASLISDGDNYYLQIRGMDLGADADLTINSSTTLTGFKATNFNVTQENQNSQIRVDGWPTDGSGWISNASNTVSNVIEGLTLNLRGAEPGTKSTITVSTDMDKVKDNIQSFVDDMNEVRSLITELTKVDSSGNGSILTGNYGLQLISQNLKSITADKGNGFSYYNSVSGLGDIFSSLSQVGILTDADEGSVTNGLLVIDDDALTEALEDNADAVAKLFAAEGDGSTDSSEFSYKSYVKNVTKPGTYDVSYSTDASGKITAAWINGHKATIDGQEITGAAGTDEAGLVISAIDLTAGTHTGSVSIKQGKFGELVDELDTLTSSETGTLKILEDNYDDIMDMIDEKIDFEQNRIDKMETNLREKYSRLEATLGEYENIQTMLESQISQLSSD